MERKQIDRHLTLEGHSKPSEFRAAWEWFAEGWRDDDTWMGHLFRGGMYMLIVVLVLLAFYWDLAWGGEPWQPAMFNGERSTVELDCEEIGLMLAPWGVDGSAIRCIDAALMEKETGEKGVYWRPTRDEFMHRYCSFHHGTSMAHYDPITFVFWCHKISKGQGA